jgi:hypothetical protein
LLIKALEDVWSQTGRIATDVTTVRDITMTASNGGLVDKRKYVVSMNYAANISNLLTLYLQIENVL